jgi:integrase
MERFGERSPLSSITQESVAIWKRERLAQVSKTTVNNDLRVLRTLLGFARERGLISDIPKFTLPKGKSHKGEIIPADQVLKLVQGLNLDDPHERGYYMVLMTGLRGTDIERLGPQHFDAATKSIVIVTNKKERKVALPLPLPLWDRLERYMGEEPFCVYPTWQRSIYFTKRLCGVAYGPRICRPTFASGLAEGGADFMVIKTLLAHKLTDITAGYISRDIEKLRAQMALLPWLDHNKFYPVVITGGA